MTQNTYGDLSPRTAAFVQRDLLIRAMQAQNIERYGQTKTLPQRSTKAMEFRRYEALELADTPLVEGVTPSGKSLTFTDVTATLEQYGDFIPITDVVEDTHEDPVIQESQELLGQQSGETKEKTHFDVIKAGTNVYYNNGTQRSDVNTVPTKAGVRAVERTLLRQNAKPITRAVSSTVNFGTQAVNPGYIALVHPDGQKDIRDIEGIIDVKDYGSVQPEPNEFGSVGMLRFVQSTIYEAFADAGGAASTNSTISTTGTSADVYPILVLGMNAYGVVPLRGRNALTPMVVQPRPASGDPLGQRGSIGWKGMWKAVILNDLFMLRWEVAFTA